MNKKALFRFLLLNKYLLLFIIAATIGWFVNKTGVNLHHEKEMVENINHILFEKEHRADLISDSLLSRFAKNTLTPWINANSKTIDDYYKEQGLAFYIFNKNQLVHWTNNAIAIPDDTLWHHKKFAKLGNAYTEIRLHQNDSIKVIALILIKTAYPYENEFIKNSFHPTFFNKCPFTIQIEPASKAPQIKNYQGEYLFSLNYLDTCNANDDARLAILFLLLALFFLMLYMRDKFQKTQFSNRTFLIFSVILLGVRAFMQIYKQPAFLSNLPVFKPQYFAFSNLFPSLGDMLITSSLVVYLIFIYYSKVKNKALTKENPGRVNLMAIVWFAIIGTYATAIQFIFFHLLVDSNFQYEAYDVLNLSVYSFIGYFILIVNYIGFILLIDKAVSQVKEALNFQMWFKSLLILTAVSSLVLLIFRQNAGIGPMLFYMLILFFWVYIRRKNTPRFGTVIILIALFAGYATYFIRKQNFAKRIEESKVLAVNLAREQDPVAEIIIGEMMNQLKTDSTVIDLLHSEWFAFDALVSHIKSSYFNGYLGRYNFQLMLCNAADSVLLDESANEWAHCYSFFNDLIDHNGSQTNTPGLYHLKNINGGINYFVRKKIDLGPGWDDVTLYLDLSSKPNFEVLGYPELLLEKPVGLYATYPHLSYAKYAGKQLIEQTGDFPYAFDLSVYSTGNQEFTFFQMEDYDHLLLNGNGENSVLVSFPTIKFFNVIISFTYIFLFLLFQVTLLLIVGNRFAHIIDFQFNIKNKIIYSLLVILLLSLIIVSSGTVFYTYRQFERSQNDILAEKMQSVLIEIEHKLADIKAIETVDPNYLASLLVKFSNVFYSDINMYNKQGNLIATSRSEIFNKKLTSTKMNAEAYRELVLNKKAKMVHKEHIGKLEYYSAYVPFLSSDRQLLAYINLPYFAKEIVLRQELMQVVVAVINIYAFLILMGIAVAIYMSNRITEPLRMLQQRIRNIDLSTKNERIDYKGKDEIAELVVDYNRMLEALDTSTKLIAKSERESAWREMARQIAHEIKNPLTPMKLSTQLLERSWKNKDADFDERFKRFTNNLIEQIDSLSSIASAFSQFAQMPQARAEKVNLSERIAQSTTLFKECSYVDFEFLFDPQIPIFVKADNERMLQVFNNLIKNAIQAMPKDERGKISIAIKPDNDVVIVEVSDTGTGIDPTMAEKLFQPNFTTKSSGTGLGLAIVKNIVEEFGGTIWFESVIGQGSTFFVSFPVFNI